MSLSLVKVASLVIASGQTTSNTLGPDDISDIEALAIQAPAALTGTVTIQGSLDNTTFVALSDGTADLTLAAAKGRSFFEYIRGFPYLRLNSSLAEAAERTFLVYKQICL